MARQTVLTGASVICYINGKPYGLVSSFQWSSTTNRKSIPELDSPLPAELAPTVAKTTGVIGLFRQAGDQGIEGTGMAAPVPQLPREKYFTIMLVERTTDSIIFRADYASVTNQTWNVPTRGLVTGTVNFEALDWTTSGRS